MSHVGCMKACEQLLRFYGEVTRAEARPAVLFGTWSSFWRCTQLGSEKHMWKPSCLPILLLSFHHMHKAVLLAASNHSFYLLEEQHIKLYY